jgi:hypothetical protein
VETTSATVTQLVDERKVEELPLNNRDLTQLAYLQPGVIKSSAGRGVFAGAGDKIAVAGARGTQNLYLLDGVSNTDLSNNPQGASGAYTGAETIKEYQVITNNYSAEYQSAAGAIVSAITKSGTNAFHGSAFWTLRNDNLDAFRWEDKAFPTGLNADGTRTPIKPEFKRNQFGGSLGGPILRDRTFFFGSYEGTRERQNTTQIATTIDDDARAGNIVNRETGEVTTVQVNPAIQPYLSLWPVAGVGNTPLLSEESNPGTIRIAGFQRQPINGDFVAAKVDHQISERWGLLSGTYNWDDSDRSPFGILGDVTEGANGGNGTISNKHTFALNHTAVLSPTTVNEFKFGYSFSEVSGDIPLGTLDTSALRFHPDRQRVGEITVTGGPDSVGYRVDSQTYQQKALQFKEGLSLTRGNHSFRLGGEIKRFRYVQQSCSRGCNGIFQFSNMSDFLTNVANDFQVFTPGHESPERNMRQLLFGSYFQDNWQMSPSFTLNLGIRYEFVTVPDEDNHLISNLVNYFDPSVSVTEQVAAQFTNELVPFSGTIEEFFQNPTLKSFSPRFGFAWAPGDRRTSLRGGYAIFYDYPMLFSLRTSLQELPPFVETARLRRAALTQGMQPLAVNVYAPQLSDPAVSSFNIRYMEFQQSNSYVHRWSLALQRELGADWVASATYTGSQGVHLLHQSLSNICRWVGWPENPTGPKQFRIPSGNATCADGLLNPRFGEVRTQSSNANSYFHGLALGLNKRMSQNFQVQLAYQFAKSIDQGSGVTSGGEEFPQGQRGIYYWDMHLKRGLSAFDIRNAFTANFTYEFPTQSLTGWSGVVAGGWQLSGILTLTDGHPLSLEHSSQVQARTIGDDENLRPNLIPGGDNNPVLGGPDQYYDASQFEPSTTGFFGTLGSNTLTSPGIAALDMSLMKNFAITENHRIQFRSDFFNLFNRPNFDDPNTTVFVEQSPNAEAGRITATNGSARQIQFGLRYSF